MNPLVACAVVGAIATIAAAVIGYMARPRVDKRNEKNPGNSSQTVRDECKDIKTALHARFDRLEDTAGAGFKGLETNLHNIALILTRIEGRLGKPGD